MIINYFKFLTIPLILYDYTLLENELNFNYFISKKSFKTFSLIIYNEYVRFHYSLNTNGFIIYFFFISIMF